MKAFIASVIGLCAFSVFGQFQWPKASVGMLEGITSTMPVPNTNQLWVSGAGTAGFNGGPYTLMQGAPNLGVGSFAYTNIVGATTTNWIIAQFGGTSSGLGGIYDQKPFIMGTSTNNWGSGSAASGYAYFSSIAINGYWTNGDDIVGPGAGTGANPPPAVTYGTNMANSASLVYVSPNYFEGQFSNRCVYVATNGNDFMASNLQCAFQTCQAAKRFAQPGDTIYVTPGIYYDHDLLKNGVDWQFEKGSLLAYDEPQVDMTSRGIFDDYAGAVTSTISGDRLHFTIPQPAVGYAIILTNPATRVVISFNQEDLASYIPSSAPFSWPGAPSLPQEGTGGGDGLLDIDAAYVDARFGLVSGFTNTVRQYLNANDSGSANTFGQYISITNSDQGFSWSQGECHINVKSMTVTNCPPAQSPVYMFSSGNNGSVESSLFLTADYVNGFLYWDDSNVKARTWLNIDFLNGPPGFPALRYAGQGVHYYTGQKVGATGSSCVDVSQGGSNFYLWANIEKLTQNGAGKWINVNPLSSSSPKTWWNVLYFEDNSGNTMTGGITIFGGTNYFFGGNLVLSNASDILIDGGITSLQGMNVQSTGTNYPIEYLNPTISTGSNALSVQACFLGTTAASCCIWATNLQGTFVYGNTNSSSCTVAATNLVHFTGIGL